MARYSVAALLLTTVITVTTTTTTTTIRLGLTVSVGPFSPLGLCWPSSDDEQAPNKNTYTVKDVKALADIGGPPSVKLLELPTTLHEILTTCKLLTLN